MRKILLGATVLAAAGAVFVVGPAQAVYNGVSCAGYGTAVGTGGTSLSVGTHNPTGTASSNGMETADPTSVAAGACLDTGNATFQGGVLEVGGGLNSNPNNRLCAGYTPVGTVQTTYPAPVGVYGVADGHSGNQPAQTSGYAGLSNYENGATEGGTGGPFVNLGSSCEPNNGSGTNSGGSVGVTVLEVTVPTTATTVTQPVGVYVPVPFVACGNDSGRTWNGTDGGGRDGCFVDNT